MKNNELEKLKPIYIHESSYSTEDEINLVGLVMILVRRKIMIAVILVAFIATGITLALLSPKKFTFSTTIEIGSQMINGSTKHFESPQALLAKLQYSYIPLVLTQYKQSNPDDKTKYQIKPSVPEGSNIMLLELKGTEKISNTLIGLLEKTSQKAIQDHSRIYQAIKNDIKARLKQVTDNLKLLKEADGNETEISANIILSEKLSTELANLRNTQQIQQPIRSLEATSASRALIVILSAFSGVFLGIFSAFFAEFTLKVKEKIKENNA